MVLPHKYRGATIYAEKVRSGQWWLRIMTSDNNILKSYHPPNQVIYISTDGKSGYDEDKKHIEYLIDSMCEKYGWKNL